MADKKQTVLVVEDEQDLREALADALHTEGYQTLQAADGEEAIAKVKESMPDIILLDIILPKLDGITVVQQLRSDNNTKHIPIILLTNVSDAQRVAEAMEYGVYDYLVKSDWELERVVEKIRNKLQSEAKREDFKGEQQGPKL